MRQRRYPDSGEQKQNVRFDPRSKYQPAARISEVQSSRGRG
jgi:hypothetical protein